MNNYLINNNNKITNDRRRNVLFNELDAHYPSLDAVITNFRLANKLLMFLGIL